MIDKTYAPLRTDFENVMSKYFPGVPLSADQIHSMEIMFFAGAASAFEVLTKDGCQRETLFHELLDHAEHLERVGM